MTYLLLLSLVFPPSVMGEEVCNDLQYEEHGQQLIHYCKAAEAADVSKENQDILVIVWAVVAGVCAVACVYSWAEAACTGVNWVGRLTEIGIGLQNEDEMQGLMEGVGVVLGQVMASSVLESGIESLFGESDNNGACATAGVAGVTSVIKAQMSQDFEDTREQNLENARRLVSNAAQLGDMNLGGNSGESGGPAQEGSGGSSLVLGNTRAGGQRQLSANSQKCDRTTNEGILKCAAAQDGTLKKLLDKNPDIASKIDEFFGDQLVELAQKTGAISSGNPQGALNEFTAQGNPEAQKEIREAIENVIKRKLPAKAYSVLSYRGSGAFKKRSKGVAQLDFKKAFGGLGKKNARGRKIAQKEVMFRQRTYDEIFNDRGLSIFYRVSERYQSVTRREF